MFKRLITLILDCFKMKRRKYYRKQVRSGNIFMMFVVKKQMVLSF